MADDSAPISNADAAEQPSNPVTATTSSDATAKGPTEPTASEITQPLPVVPELHKPANTPAAATNGDAGVNGAGTSFEPVVPEESKQSSAPTPDIVADKSAPPTSDVPGSAPLTTSGSDQPLAAADALPLENHSEPTPPTTESTNLDQQDGVKDVPVGTAAPASVSISESSVVNGGEKEDVKKNEGVPTADGEKDVELKDAAPASTTESSEKDIDMKDADPTPTAAPVASTTTVPPVPTSNGKEVTSDKRKADNGTNGSTADEEPAQKKQKGLDKVVAKAKEVIEEVKEKATPARKTSKKGKKDTVPVGRTERKTRSQGHVD